MQLDSIKPTTKNPPEQFAGDVWLDPIAFPREDGQTMIVAKVRFAPGSRTAGTRMRSARRCTSPEGIAWIGTRNGDKIEATAGQTVYCPPNEEHWHGASPDSFMEHLAMLDNADDPATTTTWLEHVSDSEYAAQP